MSPKTPINQYKMDHILLKPRKLKQVI